MTRLFGNKTAVSTEQPSASDDEGELKSPYADADWAGFEVEVAKLLEADIRAFAAAHQEETFYAVAIDCNAAYGDILLCANTPSALRDSALSYAQGASPADVEAEEDALRWGLGDWKYHGFNLDPPEKHQRYRAALPGFDELQHLDDCEQFLTSVCRALLRVERAGALEALRRTADFRVACMDHDEDLAAGDERLNQLRVLAMRPQ